MQHFNTTSTASKNARYKKQNPIPEASGVFCKVCGSRMYYVEFNVYKCPNCDYKIKIDISDSQVF